MIQDRYFTEKHLLQVIVDRFYTTFPKETLPPDSWSEKLLKVYERHRMDLHWPKSWYPFLKHQYAVSLHSHKTADSKAKAMKLWEEALADPECLDFLRSRILFAQAESHRRGQKTACRKTAISLYQKAIATRGVDKETIASSKLGIAKIYRIGARNLARDSVKAKDMFQELYETLKIDHPQFPQVLYGLACCHQDGLDGVVKNLDLALTYYHMLFRVGCPEFLVAGATGRKKACEEELEKNKSAFVQTQEKLKLQEHKANEVQALVASLEAKLTQVETASSKALEEKQTLARELAEKLEAFSAKETAFQDELNEKERAYIWLRSETELLKKELATAESDTSKTLEEQKRLESEHAEKREALKESKRAYERLSSDYASLKTEVAQVKAFASQTLEEKQMLERKFAEKVEAFSAKEKELQEALEEKSRLSRDLDQQTKLVESHMVQIAKFTDEIVQLKAHTCPSATLLSGQTEALERSVFQLKMTLYNRNVEIEDQRTDFTRQLGSLQIALNMKDTQIADLKEYHEEQIRRLQQERNQIEESYRSLDYNASLALEKVRTLLLELEEAKQRDVLIEQQKQQIADLKEVIADYEWQNSEEESKRLLADKEKELAELNNRLSTIEAEVARTKQESESKLSEINANLQLMQAHNAMLQTELDSKVARLGREKKRRFLIQGEAESAKRRFATTLTAAEQERKDAIEQLAQEQSINRSIMKTLYTKVAELRTAEQERDSKQKELDGLLMHNTFLLMHNLSPQRAGSQLPRGKTN